MPVTGREWEFEAIGTRWTVLTEHEVTSGTKQRVAAQIAEYDQAFSRFRADSTVWNAAHAAREQYPFTVEFPRCAAPLFELYDELYALTNGAVNPLVGNSLSSLGYDETYSFTPKQQLVAASWDDVTRSGPSVTFPTPQLLDVGAAGKGQLVDLVASVLLEDGHDQFTVDAGGDIGHRGEKIRIGLEHPADTNLAIGVVDLENQAIAASATNRRRWGDGLHHVLDARTGGPTDETVIATWAVSDTAMVSDGLATALFFVPPEWLESRFTFEWVRVFSDLTLEYSSNLKGTIFS